MLTASPKSEEFSLSVKKRLVLPLWWVQSFVMEEQRHAATLIPPALPSIYSVGVFEIWHGLSNRFVSGSQEKHLEIDVTLPTRDRSKRDRILLAHQNYWTAGFELRDQVAGTLGTTRLNLIQQCSVVPTDAGFRVSLSLASSLTTFCTGRLDGSKEDAEFISLNKNILSSLCHSSKRLCDYLRLELDRAQFGSRMCTKVLSFGHINSDFKSHVQNASHFYEHGALAWQGECPRQSLQELGAVAGKVLRVQRYPDISLEIKKFEEKFSTETAKSSSPIRTEVRSEAPVRDIQRDDPEIEFWNSVSAFYESLTPMQRKSFERERQRLSPDQFRNYVTPILSARRNALG